MNVPLRQANAIELAYHNLTPALSRLSMVAKGRTDMINPEKVIANVADLRVRLRELEAVARAEKAARAEAKKAEARALKARKLAA